MFAAEIRKLCQLKEEKFSSLMLDLHFSFHRFLPIESNSREWVCSFYENGNKTHILKLHFYACVFDARIKGHLWIGLIWPMTVSRCYESTVTVKVNVNVENIRVISFIDSEALLQTFWLFWELFCAMIPNASYHLHPIALSLTAVFDTRIKEQHKMKCNRI